MCHIVYTICTAHPYTYNAIWIKMRSFAAIKIKRILHKAELSRAEQSARATSICVARCMHVILHILLGAQTKDSSISANCHISYIYTRIALLLLNIGYQTSNNHSLLISSFIFHCNIRFLTDFSSSLVSFRFVQHRITFIVRFRDARAIVMM